MIEMIIGIRRILFLNNIEEEFLLLVRKKLLFVRKKKIVVGGFRDIERIGSLGEQKFFSMEIGILSLLSTKTQLLPMNSPMIPDWSTSTSTMPGVLGWNK